jgi:16S rRNA (adenine1518-N6/adenine1519-N6)-dimethyltransferase
MDKPKKSLGQHWLYDDAALEAVVQGAEVGSGDTVLEIGPGLGTLTKKLTEKAGKVIAVELDQTLASALPSRIFAKNLNVVNQDILRFDLTNMPPGYKVVANIPYYLTSNLLRVLCESSNPFSKAALLVQKEVAERVCAAPGQMSLLSVSVQFYCQAQLGPTVPAKLFTPPPKVDSQILQLTFRVRPLYSDVDAKQFFSIVKAGFSQKRKTLLNSLSAGLRLPREQTFSALEGAGVNPENRAQNLSLDEWHRLYLTLM